MTALLDAPPTPVPPGGAGTADRQHGLVPAVLGGTLLLGGVGAVLVAALLVGGGAPAPATAGLPDAGPVVGWGPPVVELLVRLLAVLVVGSLLVPALLHPASSGAPASRRALRTAGLGAVAWAAAEVTGLVLLTGSLLGRPVTALVPGDVLAVVRALPAGRTAPVVLLLLGVVAAGALAALRSPRTPTGLGPAGRSRVLLLVALAAVVLPVATTGHPAAAGDHVATVVVLAVHVVAACLWTGGLLGLLLHVRGPGSSRASAVARLSTLALACVAAIAATGVAGALLLGEVTAATLLGTGWGQLLLTKTAAVLALVSLGWLHRRRTMPLLRAGRPGAFLRLAVGETGLMAATLAVAVGLSAAPPPEPAAAAAVTAAPGPAAPAQAPGAAPAQDRAQDPAPVPAEDMSGHDHGDLSVAVLVDDDRLHVGSPVRPGSPVTVYNTGATEVVLLAEDGGFRSVVPSRTFMTFLAPDVPGSYAFGDPDQPRYADVLQVALPVG